MRRLRNAKVVATLGPAGTAPEAIDALLEAGADALRLNFSHGMHDDHRQRLDTIRVIECERGWPIGVLLDLQGPKLHIGTFENSPVQLASGDAFRLGLDRDAPGSCQRVGIPHLEIFAVLHKGTELLLDDGKIRLRVDTCGADFADTTIVNGGTSSDHKGVNMPDVMLPLSALTEKDRRGLDLGLTLGIDWIALPFIQWPEDIRELEAIIQGRASIVAKLEKPTIIQSLEATIDGADAVMVARGDLGVEMLAEQVPSIQKQIVRACRKTGKPVIVATQMLESMITAPMPTCAETSDAVTAIYDGVDAVMLSAESVSGRYPIEAVMVMDSIIRRTESDPLYHDAIQASHTPPRTDAADAIGYVVRHVAGLFRVPAAVAYISSGYSALHMARERPGVLVLGMTPRMAIARRLTPAWGVHAVLCHEVVDMLGITELTSRTVLDEHFGERGQSIVISAGLPFTVAGTTNLLHITQVQRWNTQGRDQRSVMRTR